MVTSAIFSRWFEAKDDADLEKDVLNYVAFLQDADNNRRQRELVHDALYETDFSSGGYGRATSYLGSMGIAPVSLNVCRSVVDTVYAKVAKNQPALKIETDGAQYSQRLQAKRISKWLNVKMEQSEFRSVAPLAFRDAEKHGTGIIKTSSWQGRVISERVPHYELLADPIEAYYGKPRQLFQVKMVAREVLLASFPKKTPEIREAKTCSADELRDHFQLDLDYTETKHDMVKVVEAWHLPSGPDAEDGLHAIIIDGGVLQRSTYDRDDFPFDFIYWNTPDHGIWGTGLIAELASIQWEIQECLRVIQDSLHIGGRLKVFLSRSSKIVRTQLNNKIGAITDFTGQPPIFQAPNPVSQQLFDWLKLLYQWAYEIPGVSQLSAQAKLPPRMGDSSIAMQTYYDIETERFSPIAIGYSNFHVNGGYSHLAAMKELAASDHDAVEDNDRDEHIDWDKLDLRKDALHLKMEAENFLPETRAGKLSLIKELAGTQLPLLDKLLGQQVEQPDLKNMYSVINAAQNNAAWIVEQLEDPRRDLPEPEALTDFSVAVPLVKAAFQDSQAQGDPEEVLQRYRDWLTLAVAFAKPPEPPVPPEGPPPDMQPPPGPPGPPGPPMGPA